MDATAPTAAAQEEGAAPKGEEIPPSEAAVKAPPELPPRNVPTDTEKDETVDDAESHVADLDHPTQLHPHWEIAAAPLVDRLCSRYPNESRETVVQELRKANGDAKKAATALTDKGAFEHKRTGCFPFLCGGGGGKKAVEEKKTTDEATEGGRVAADDENKKDEAKEKEGGEERRAEDSALDGGEVNVNSREADTSADADASAADDDKKEASVVVEEEKREEEEEEE